jgi:mannan endo-1,4-beta-mannosidase
MKFIQAILLVIVWSSFCKPLELENENQSQYDWSSMVERKGTQFVVNGSPFYVNGFNTYWLMLLAVDPSTRKKVTSVLEEAATAGFTVARTWAFNDGGWRALQKSPGVYDEQVFQALDFVLSEARRNKIRLILSLVNNWDAYGGKAQYVTWGRSAGLKLNSNDAFFSDPTLKSYFKAHVKAVLTRVNTLTKVTYKDDPTIFAWELMNEPRCQSDPTGNTLHAWIEEMAAHVKSIDPKHMLEIGMEGFYGPSVADRLKFNPYSSAQKEGTDFIRNHQALGIDFASVHIYTVGWIGQYIIPTHLKFVRNWMLAHIQDSEQTLNMPVLFAEFGVSERVGGYNVSYRETFMQTVYNSVLTSIRTGGAAGGSLLWQLFPEDTEYMNDGYGIVLSKNPSTAKLISLQSSRLLTFNSLCNWNCKWGCAHSEWDADS